MKFELNQKYILVVRHSKESPALTYEGVVVGEDENSIAIIDKYKNKRSINKEIILEAKKQEAVN